jgi:hypothetical protein
MEHSPVSTVLGRDECLDRLTAAPLARILISVRCLPSALPARIRVLDREKILIATSDPAILLAAERHDVLTVQVDGIDDDDHTWSVVASGIALDATRAPPLDDLLGDAIGHGGHLVSFVASVIAGQRH